MACRGIEDHIPVQRAAKQALSHLAEFITSQSTERDIAQFAADSLSDLGYADTWYYDCPALVLLGSRSCQSPSGRNYEPSAEYVGQTNLITVDLSPCDGTAWGDCARSFYVEGGAVVQEPSAREFVQGRAALSRLHRYVLETATPETTFQELYDAVAKRVRELGFLNLDAGNNFGHSICEKLEERVYVSARSDTCLGEVEAFTFEPHVRREGGRWGYKHEDIYYFGAEGELRVLC